MYDSYLFGFGFVLFMAVCELDRAKMGNAPKKCASNQPHPILSPARVGCVGTSGKQVIAAVAITSLFFFYYY